MKKVHLKKVHHEYKVGDRCASIDPNVTDDCIIYDNGDAVGFYIKNLEDYSSKAAKVADIADRELRSERVPKTEMSRGPQGTKKDKAKRIAEGKRLVTQYSAILGGVPPKPHMRRPYATISSVHSVPSARNFVKAMMVLCRESEAILKEILPEQYKKQKQLIEENAPKKYRFGDLFTSSISNCNIAADYHIDRENIVGCVNVIIAKRKGSSGGNTTVPDYGATFLSSDNSMLVYPAWRNLHGVTPIVPETSGGYRNTLVFYPLKSFKGCR